MTTLSSGVLLKLLDGMKTGAAKPVGEHRTAVLQVTDIVPADLDEKDLVPTHGQFYVKVSDASHSIYAMLPLAQADLVLSNKLHLGQFVHVATPDPAAKTKHDRTPVKDRPAMSTPVRQRAYAASPSLSTASVRKSSSVLPRLTKGKSVVADRDNHPRMPKSPFASEKSSMSSSVSRPTRRIVKEEEPLSLPDSYDELGSSATSSKKLSSTAARVPVPGELSVLGKEAIEQMEQAQKVALEALRNASATDNVVRMYKNFSELSKTAKPDSPATCFDSFLSFHQEAVQAVSDIEAIQAAMSMAAADVASDEQPEDAPPVLSEIAQNRATTRRRALSGRAVSKSVSFAPGTLDPRNDGGSGSKGRGSSASRKWLVMDKISEDSGDEKRSSSSAATATTHSALGSSLRLAKQIQAEARSWFMEFLEAALETGLKKKSKASSTTPDGCGCPQPLILRVVNWVEMEQSGGDGSRKPAHPRAAAIARKLRIKAKTP